MNNSNKKDRLTGRSKAIQAQINIFPKNLRLILNPRRRAVENFVKEASKKIKKGARILDAGAGPCPYKPLFKDFNYEATDIKKDENMDFACSLDKIPKEKNTYDAVISTEVLEHVEYPQKVVNEFHRILKKGGKLFLTVPQSWHLHQEPYNFYYFTKYGLRSLLENAGFRNIKITPMGGYFWYLADTIRFNRIIEQRKKNKFIYYPLRILEYPITNILLPLILFPLDSIDRERKWTLGYTVEAEK